MAPKSVLVAVLLSATMALSSAACFCPTFFAPVCCRTGGVERTVPNICFCNGCGLPGKFVSVGVCSPKPTVAPPCKCPDFHSPVCCKEGSRRVTRRNHCECTGCGNRGVLVLEKACGLLPDGDFPLP